jgi:hypothetical protein
VPPGRAEAAAVIAAHPDADLVLVFDALHARYGATTAGQVASLVELAMSVGESLNRRADESPPRRSAARPQADTDGLPAVRASDVVHLRLTDKTLELTNRTHQRVRLGVTLGSTDDERVRAVFEALLGPGEKHTEPVDAAPALARLAPPTAVMRHWSHCSAEVYEGGQRRILAVEAAVLDADDRVFATRTYESPNGLDFAMTARDLRTLLGRQAATPQLFTHAQAPAKTAASRDLFAALESALRVGADALKLSRDRT